MNYKLASLTLAGILGLWAAPLVAQSAQAPAEATKATAAAPLVLLELFTSEGCSSCPPADDLLGRMSGRLMPSGQRVVLLSEHVTYWNQGGWRDPYSAELFTNRQRDYADAFNLDEVYTPQVVINGRREGVGSDGPGLLKAIASAGQALPLTLQVVRCTVSADHLEVLFRLEGQPPRGAVVVAALTDNRDQQTVLRGENAGRRLSHVNVVRSWASTGALAAGTDTLVRLALPTPMPGTLPALPASKDATAPPATAKTSASASGHSLVLFAQARGLGPILAVAWQPLELDFPTATEDAAPGAGRTLKPR